MKYFYFIHEIHSLDQNIKYESQIISHKIFIEECGSQLTDTFFSQSLVPLHHLLVEASDHRAEIRSHNSPE